MSADEIKAAMQAANQPQLSQYKGHPMIVLNPQDSHPFQFGHKKACLIRDSMQFIVDFANACDEAERAKTGNGQG